MRLAGRIFALVFALVAVASIVGSIVSFLALRLDAGALLAWAEFLPHAWWVTAGATLIAYRLWREPLLFATWKPQPFPGTPRDGSSGDGGSRERGARIPTGRQPGSR